MFFSRPTSQVVTSRLQQQVTLVRETDATVGTVDLLLDDQVFAHELLPRDRLEVVISVLLAAAFDVASAFPLNALTLGNNLMSAFYGGSRTQPLGTTYKYLFRVLAAVPPLLGASVIKDLSVITKYTGLCGFALGFVFPPLLGLASEKWLTSRGYSGKTHYSSAWTGRAVQYGTLAVGSFLIVYVLACNILDL